jgi:hypothetical protein
MLETRHGTLAALLVKMADTDSSPQDNWGGWQLLEAVEITRVPRTFLPWQALGWAVTW